MWFTKFFIITVVSGIQCSYTSPMTSETFPLAIPAYPPRTAPLAGTIYFPLLINTQMQTELQK